MWYVSGSFSVAWYVVYISNSVKETTFLLKNLLF